MLPQPFTVRPQGEFLDLYGEVCGPDVDVFGLASWLLTVAITAQQIPQGSMTDEVRLKKWHSFRDVSQHYQHGRKLNTVP